MVVVAAVPTTTFRSDESDGGLASAGSSHIGVGPALRGMTKRRMSKSLLPLTAENLARVTGGETSTKPPEKKASTFELHFTCESVDFSAIK